MEAKEWIVHFEKYIRELDKKKPVVWVGDMNADSSRCADKFLIDRSFSSDSNPKRNRNKTAGYMETETTAFKRLLEPCDSEPDPSKFVDVWRGFCPDEQHFSYRFNCRAMCRPLPRSPCFVDFLLGQQSF